MDAKTFLMPQTLCKDSSMDRMISAGTDAPRALPRAALLRALAGFAIVAQLALNASAWLLPQFSQFSAIGDYMSELVLGRHGWV